MIEFYKEVLRKEKEQVEEDKKKKLREVELWTRAVREEEKLVIEQYAKENPDDQRTAAIEDLRRKRTEREKAEKQALESARGVFEAHMAKAMANRREEWEQSRQEFKAAQMDDLKRRILEHARKAAEKARNDLKTQER